MISSGVPGNAAEVRLFSAIFVTRGRLVSNSFRARARLPDSGRSRSKMSSKMLSLHTGPFYVDIIGCSLMNLKGHEISCHICIPNFKWSHFWNPWTVCDAPGIMEWSEIFWACPRRQLSSVVSPSSFNFGVWKELSGYHKWVSLGAWNTLLFNPAKYKLFSEVVAHPENHFHTLPLYDTGDNGHEAGIIWSLIDKQLVDSTNSKKLELYTLISSGSESWSTRSYKEC